MAAAPVNPTPQKPWHFSSATIQALNQEPGSKKSFTVLTAAHDDVARVAEWYLRYPVPGFSIKTVEAIHNTILEQAFAVRVKILEERFGNEKLNPKWSEQSKTPAERILREKAIALLKGFSKHYEDEESPHVTLFPAWHGTSIEALQSIFKTGFVNLGTTDPGYYGKGIYNTGEAAYAEGVYSKGRALLVNWVALYSAFPVIKTDNMATFLGGNNHENYDAHFIPVAPANPNNLKESVYYPCEIGQPHTFTEIVVFAEAQVLPRYRVILQSDLSVILVPQPSVTVNDFLEILTTFQDHLGKESELNPIIDKVFVIYGSQNRNLNAKEQQAFHLVNRIAGAETATQKASFTARLFKILNQITNESQEEEKQDKPAFAPAPKSKIIDQDAVRKEYLKAIYDNPLSPEAPYNQLGEILPMGENVQLLDGRVISKEGLFLEATKCNPKNSQAFRNFGQCLSEGIIIMLTDGRRMSKQDLLLEAIKLDQANSSAYSALSETISLQGAVQVSTKGTWKKLDLLIEAIKCDAHNAQAYVNLAKSLEIEESVELADGRKVDRRSLCLEALKLDGNIADAYLFLGTGAAGDTLELPDGRKLNKRELYLESLKRDPKNYAAYNALGGDLSMKGSIQLPDGRRMDKKNLIFEAIKLNPRYAPAYVNLGHALSARGIRLWGEENTQGREISRSTGRVVDERGLYYQALKIDSEYARAYKALSTTLVDDENILLPDGRLMDKQALLTESTRHIERSDKSSFHDPYRKEFDVQHTKNEIVKIGNKLTLDSATYCVRKIWQYYGEEAKESSGQRLTWIQSEQIKTPHFYVRLGELLGGSAKLPDGRILNKKSCYLEAIQLDQTCTEAYLALVELLDEKTIIKLHDKRKMDKQKLRYEALKSKCALHLDELKINPQSAKTYVQLGNYLKKGETIELTDGHKWDNKSLFLKSLRFNSPLAEAYNSLGHSVGQEAIQLPDGRIMNDKTLYFEAIKLNPSFSEAYYNLSCILAQNAIIKLPDGRVMDDKTLLLEAIKCNPRLAQGYYVLAKKLTDEEHIKLPDGRLVNKKALYLETIRWNPQCADAYYQLGLLLSIQESIKLHNGRSMNKLSLYMASLRWDPSQLQIYALIGCLHMLTDPSHKSVKLLDGRWIEHLCLFYEAFGFEHDQEKWAQNVIEIDPRCSVAYLYLAEIKVIIETKKTIASYKELFKDAYVNFYKESFRLNDGREMHKKELCLEAIKYSPRFALAYIYLGKYLNDGEIIKLHDGRNLSNQDLFLEAIKLEPQNAAAYYYLGKFCKKERIQLPNGEKLNQQELYLKAIALSPHRSKECYEELADMLWPWSTLKMLDGSSLNKESLMKKSKFSQSLLENGLLARSVEIKL